MRFFKYLIICTILFSISECSTLNQSNDTGYFDFDKAIHYKIEYSSLKMHQIRKKKDKTEEDILLLGIYYDTLYDSINKNSVFNNLETLGYRKNEISTKKNKKLKEIFKNRNLKKGYTYTCIPEFKDIIIFKKRQELVGVAKIAFECKKNRILGSKTNTFDFGQKGNYEKLQKILHEK